MSTPIQISEAVREQLKTADRVVLAEGHSDRTATGCAPNGSSVCEHIVREHVSVYAADYYGTGPHVYAEGSTSYVRLDTGDSVADPYSGWSDGHPDRVRARARGSGVELR